MDVFFCSRTTTCWVFRKVDIGCEVRLNYPRLSQSLFCPLDLSLLRNDELAFGDSLIKFLFFQYSATSLSFQSEAYFGIILSAAYIWKVNSKTLV